MKTNHELVHEAITRIAPNLTEEENTQMVELVINFTTDAYIDGFDTACNSDMPRNLDRLKREALESCILRGHDMGDWVPRQESRAYAECKQCAQLVVVNVHPLPNSTNIGGGAIATACK